MAIEARVLPFATLSLLLACAGPPPPHAAPPAAPPPTAPVTVPASSPTPDSAALPSGLGQISFPISGSEACPHHFRDGMLALHSFWYDRAHASFETALKVDPACAMAAW